MIFQSPEDFLGADKKIISLIGMSGTGKTTIARRLPIKHWFHYSIDYVIGNHYLHSEINNAIRHEIEQLSDSLKTLLKSSEVDILTNVTVDNILIIASFIGKLGSQKHGGLPMDTFTKRQDLYMQAEQNATLDLEKQTETIFSKYNYKYILNDLTGSICEIINFDDPNDKILKFLTEKTIIVYIRPDDAHYHLLLESARQKPKPILYNREFLLSKITEFMSQNSLTSIDQIHPTTFFSFVFPDVIKYRRQKYEALASNGYVITMDNFRSVKNETDLLQLIAESITLKQKTNR